ncbi:hypothetical protein EZV61_03475 [Corallincola luteus]|uniref:Uncharacterized protein n=1 Tax=Corallincola luteus TaxID=1775177 RepID=A0ABY2ASA6_9GAMM|nr:hypothetical protein [Corallincola luteus]TCI05037.1 hypothetical protein EZV61_03475 [Corallincola luteus]
MAGVPIRVKTKAKLLDGGEEISQMIIAVHPFGAGGSPMITTVCQRPLSSRKQSDWNVVWQHGESHIDDLRQHLDEDDLNLETYDDGTQ